MMRSLCGAAVAVVMMLGCQRGEEVPLPSRVDAIVAKVPTASPATDFCDTLSSPESARAFAFPPLVEGAPAAKADRWRWVNVWATWCKPCVEEMPMIHGWVERLARADKGLDLVFLSVDEDAAAYDRFVREREGFVRSVRMQGAGEDAALEQWLGTLGLGAEAALPIQVFVDPQGRTRCVRTGALSYYHYDAVAALVSGR